MFRRREKEEKKRSLDFDSLIMDVTGEKRKKDKSMCLDSDWRGGIC